MKKCGTSSARTTPDEDGEYPLQAYADKLWLDYSSHEPIHWGLWCFSDGSSIENFCTFLA